VIGHPTVFVRVGGCDYRCSWCDSLHAVLPEHREEWTKLSPSDVWWAIRRLSPKPILVTLSGGNPAMYGELREVIEHGHRQGYTFGVETQGTISQTWFSNCEYVVFSPKPPSSGMKYDYDRLRRCIEAAAAAPTVVLKVPIFNSDDFFFAEQVGKQFPNLPLYLSVGNPNPPIDSGMTEELRARDRGQANLRGLLEHYDWLCQMVLQRGTQAIVLPQLHVLVWGNKRGV
jgi:7-carboxy-7-deazaguanine synthase